MIWKAFTISQKIRNIKIDQLSQEWKKMPPKLRQFLQTTNWMGSASNVNRYITNDRAPMTSFHFTFRNIYFEWKLNTNRPKTNVHTSHCVNAEMEATLILFAFSEMSKYY